MVGSSSEENSFRYHHGHLLSECLTKLQFLKVRARFRDLRCAKLCNKKRCYLCEASRNSSCSQFGNLGNQHRCRNARSPNLSKDRLTRILPATDIQSNVSERSPLDEIAGDPHITIRWQCSSHHTQSRAGQAILADHRFMPRYCPSRVVTALSAWGRCRMPKLSCSNPEFVRVFQAMPQDVLLTDHARTL